jgi:hypothetical protein
MTDTSRPFAEKKFTEVKGHRMAYIDEGEGAPIVFQHGNPTGPLPQAVRQPRRGPPANPHLAAPDPPRRRAAGGGEGGGRILPLARAESGAQAVFPLQAGRPRQRPAARLLPRVAEPD